MKNLLFLLLILTASLALGETKSDEVTYSGGDGATTKTAIVITAPNEDKGVAAEYAYIHKHFPGSISSGQGVLNEEKKIYDKMTFRTSNGEQKTLYFDITNFFGKF